MFFIKITNHVSYKFITDITATNKLHTMTKDYYDFYF